MILALEIVVLLFGLYMLATGTIPLSGYGSREGMAVRIAGLLLLTPIPIGLSARHAMGLPLVGSPPKTGAEMYSVQPRGAAASSRAEEDMWTVSLIELGVTFGAIAVGSLIIFLGGVRPSAYPRGFGADERPPGPRGESPPG
jgi:hypothetical protein